MTVKTPIRTVFDNDGNATGLAEFQTGERVGISHGGTGLASVGTAGQVLAVNANTDGLEYVDSDTATINDRMQVANTQALHTSVTANLNSYIANTNPRIATNASKISQVESNLLSTNTSIRSAITTEVNNLVDSAPGALDTLNELAAALGDDANFASSVTTNLSQKLGSTATVTMVGDLTGSNSFSSNATSIVTTLASTGTPTGTFGSGSLVPVITVDAKGRITNISNTSVAGVSSTAWTPANNNLRISTADGSTYDTTIGSFITVANTQALHTSVTANLNSYIANTNPRIASNDTDISNLLTSVSGTNTAIRALVTTESGRIDNVLTSISGTNTSIRTLVSDRMQVANTIALANARLGATASVTLSGDVSGSASFSGNSVSITTTVADDSHNHIIGNVDGLQAALDNRMTVANTQTLVGDRLGATATVEITGDVAGGPTAFSGNTVSIAVTQQNNSVDLGTHTTGNYVATIAGTTNEVEVSGSGSETAAVTIGLPNDVTLTGDLTVSGGDITLGGTGRIQGVDTVSAGTDAANKTYVDNAVAGVVDSAPAALDTLNELAAALGDDANFATTVSTNIGQKLGATATVTLTGDVTGTASFSANAVSIATTYNNDVVLGTDTSGNYVATITGGTGIDSSAATTGEGTTHTLSLDLNELATSTTNTDGDYFVVVDSADGSQHKLTKGSIAISGFSNDAGFSTTTGTVTSVGITAGSGIDVSGGPITSSGNITVSVESDLRSDVFQIGRDTNDYYIVNTTTHDWYLDGVLDMRLENDGDLHVEGDVVSESTTVSSDEKLKENIEVVENAVEKIHQLRGVEFNWKKSGRKSAGVIAQDVEKVLPQAVKEVKSLAEDEDAYLTVKYDSLHALTIEAIKTMSDEIAALKEEIKILKGE